MHSSLAPHSKTCCAVPDNDKFCCKFTSARMATQHGYKFNCQAWIGIDLS